MTNADKSRDAPEGVLITGGGGFVGGYLRAHLGALGERVWTGVFRDGVYDDAPSDQRVKLDVRDGARRCMLFSLSCSPVRFTI